MTTIPSALKTPREASAFRPSLAGMTLAELQAVVNGMGEPAFRAQQLHQWIYVKGVRDFEAMTNLAKGFCEKLDRSYTVGCLEIADKQVSADGTLKYLFRLPDGQKVESVLMHFEERDSDSLCISSQVGCAVDCSFCATGKLGFKRHLSVAEIVDQFLAVKHDSGRNVRNIVFMGQGEPLLNYDNVLAAIRILNKSAEVGIRHITLSTAGIVPKIRQLAGENLQVVLAVSLHAPDDETRTRIMPINAKWPVATLIETLHDYVNQTGRRITIEYVMLAGVNDSAEQAHRLGKLLRGLKCNVNLIPYNPIGEQYGYSRPARQDIDLFQHIVASYGKKVTARLERGVDIAAACGQLANQHLTAQQPGGCCG